MNGNLMTKRPFIHLFIRFFFLSLFLSGTLNEEFSSLSSPWVPRRAMTSLTTGKQLEGINAAPSLPTPHPNFLLPGQTGTDTCLS